MRGEDYCFTFTGKLRDGKLHFRLHMEWEGDGDAAGEAGTSKTIDFVYDPDSDTPGACVCGARCVGAVQGQGPGQGGVQPVLVLPRRDVGAACALQYLQCRQPLTRPL